MEYEAVIHALIDSIVEHPESILIRKVTEEEKDIVLVIASEKNDTARLIGKKGVIANSLREMISVLGKSEGKHIHLKFESFDSDNE